MSSEDCHASPEPRYTSESLPPGHEKPPKDRLARALLNFMQAQERVQQLSDRELCAEVIDKVWGKQILGSDQDWLVDEIVQRFEIKCGIERDDEGRVIPEK